MWFKNLRVYRFTQPFELTPEQLDQALQEQAFTPCGSQDVVQYGWVPPLGRHGESLVHAANGYIMVCAKKQEKVLPAAVVNEQVEERAIALSEQEARHVGRKERQNIKDDVLMDMLPKAFARSSLQFAYIAPQEGWLVIDSAAAKRAEELIIALREAVGSLPVIPLVSKQQPHQTMTHWLTATTAPDNFDFGHECVLKDPQETSSVIRCKHQELTSTEINSHLQAGMLVSQLGLTWHNGIDCLVDEQLTVKRLKFADEIQEQADLHDAQEAAEQFDIEFTVMTLELSAFIRALVHAFGGINEKATTVEEIMVAVENDQREHEAAAVEEVAF